MKIDTDTLQKILNKWVEENIGNNGNASVMFGDDQIVIGQNEGSLDQNEWRNIGEDLIKELDIQDIHYEVVGATKHYVTLLKVIMVPSTDPDSHTEIIPEAAYFRGNEAS
jgi:hypothetical protein